MKRFADSVCRFVFLSLGLLARRRRTRLTREVSLDGAMQSEPEMWQPLYRAATKPTWSDVIPLSASYIWREVVEDFQEEPPRRRLAVLGISSTQVLAQPPTQDSNTCVGCDHCYARTRPHREDI
ncbi:hypothetical protein C8F01DRAFT_238279 [Mycena amicta]|nr:hypothetical protein C8F01DRAFT_238279 [Mycena amicta]